MFIGLLTQQGGNSPLPSTLTAAFIYSLGKYLVSAS